MQSKCKCPPNVWTPLARKFLTALLLFVMSGTIAMAQEKRISIAFNNEKASAAFKKLETMSDYVIQFNYKDADYRVTLNAKQKTVPEIVRMIIGNRSLSMEQKGKYLTIVRKAVTENQQPASKEEYFTGIVLDENDKPLAGATITVKFSDRGDLFASTDVDGNFMLQKRGGETSLTASFLGYEKETYKVKAGKNNYTFRLDPSTESMDEVVVTGIFNKPKVSFTGAATTISKEEIAATGTRNLLKAITFIDPTFHLMENNSSGSNPNQTMYFQVRGASSINSDINNLQTDIVNERNMPLFILDGFEVTSERVMDMNQTDVESIVILKDVSATAIYGSRGANGVVVITSAKPALGKLKVSYSVGLNLEIPDLSSYKSLSSLEKIAIEKEAGLYTGNTLSDQLRLDEIYNTNLKAANEGVNTDWIHKPVQVGVGQYHKVDLSGGSDQFRYILNLSYNSVKGAMKGSERNNMNGNMTISYLLKKVRLTNTLSIGMNDSKNSPYGSFSEYVNMNPYWRPYDENGEPVMGFSAIDSSYLTANPLYNAAQTSFSKSDYTNIRNTTVLDMDIIKNVRTNINFGYSWQHGESDDFTSPKDTRYTIEYTSLGPEERGLYQKGYTDLKTFQIGATISWSKVYGDHSLYAGFNGQVIETQTSTSQIYVKGFMNDQMTDMSNANSYEYTRPTSDESTTRSIGLTGTFNYNYASRYFFDASYRADGASSFGSESRWAPFWSVGVGWDMANEPLMKKYVPQINQMKIRYSYGVTGSLNFEPYDALTTYKYNTTEQYNGFVGAVITSYGNPNLQWQETKQHNVGIDLLLFNSRLSASFNYYRKTTSNLLSEMGLSASHGYSSYKENIGVVRNTGYDFTLSYTILRDNEKKINWAVRAGASHNENVIVSLSESLKKQVEQYETSSVTGNTYYQYREGYSMSDLWVYESVGIDPESGKRLYVDENGTVTPNYSQCRKVSVGSSLPTLDTRFGTSFRWKGLMIDLGFAYTFGAKKINRTLMDKVENAVLRNNVDPRVVQLRWKQPGDIAAYKNIASTDATMDNTCFVFTEKTFTFNSVNITYELPKEWIRRFKMERLAVTATMSDILYISNIEQERGTGYPYSIKPTFSLSCTF